MVLEKIKTFILDTLFPIHCLFCQKYGNWICTECFSRIEILSEQVCPYCEKNIALSGKVCDSCKNKILKKNDFLPLDGLIVSAKYRPLSKIIHLYKYNFVRDLNIPLARAMISALIGNNAPLPDLIIPIPLHNRRLRWRGFNQAELLADYIGQNLTPGFSIPVIPDLIVRKKYTPPQMKIKNYQERQKNLRDAFSIFLSPSPLGGGWREAPGEGETLLKDKTILLVDDICTTSSTLLECAKVLKLNGAKKVFAAVIARQEMD